MNIANWLYATSRKSPEAPALFAGESLVANYRLFASRASSIAQSLQHQQGIGEGDRIGVVMDNRTEYLECLYAIWWLGAVAVPINAKFHVQEVLWILNNADAALVMTSDKIEKGLEVALAGELDGVDLLSVDSDKYQQYQKQYPVAPPACRNADDLAWLFYTSGTTGRPKGVMLSYGNLGAMSLCYPVDVDVVSAQDAIVYAAPISHGAGLYSFIHVRCGARHVVPVSGGFDEYEVLDLANNINHVSLFAAPTMVKRIVKAAKERGSQGEGIKTIVYGGGPMYLADIQAGLDQLGPRFVQIFGQGESPMTITALSRDCHIDQQHPRYLERLASVGTAHSIVEIRITDKQGSPQQSGQPGEIEVKGSTVMLGYWKNPKATQEILRGGWLRTGDIGVLDEDGFLTLHDRSKDVVISGGSNVYPREVEEVLLTHPDVKEVSVIGKPDLEWGEVVVAFIVSHAGLVLSEESLDAHCLEKIARFKRPKKYEFVDSLPKNNYGKVLKNELREWVDSMADPI